MSRRDFVARLGGAVLAWPLAALAQRPAMPLIGYLSSLLPNERPYLLEAFHRGLKEGGYVDGQNVAIEYRWAEGRYDRLPVLVAELVNRNVAVIVATGTMTPAVAAKAATSTIPIVFSGSGDPVKLGLVASLSRPGSNATGVTNIASSLDAKRLEILRELVPAATRIAYLVNPNVAGTKSAIKEIQAAAEATAIKIHVVNASSADEIDAAFSGIKQRRANALLVTADPFFTSQRDHIVRLAARHAIPTSYPFRDFAVAGGLMSYGTDLMEVNRQLGIYAARILKGAKAADLPVIQATKFELVVNLKTAKKLGLMVPRDFLARVDEVIE